MSELKDRFAHALSPEPPFETDLTTALDAAVRGGRRRRARAVASKGLAVAACAVILGGAVVAIRPGGTPASGASTVQTASPAPTPPPELCSDLSRVDALKAAAEKLDQSSKARMYLREDQGPLPTVSIPPEKAAVLSPEELKALDAPLVRIPARTTAGGPTPQVSDGAEPCWDGLMQGGKPLVDADVSDAVLTTLVKAVVASTGGKVSVQSPSFVTVRTDTGTYSVSVGVWALQYDPQEWIESCSPSKGDAKPCTVEGSSARDMARSTKFTDGSGRASLQYVADAGTDADGNPLTLDIDIDNYVEQGAGQKVVGPTWQELGFTRAGLRAAVEDSGAFS